VDCGWNFPVLLLLIFDDLTTIFVQIKIASNFIFVITILLAKLAPDLFYELISLLGRPLLLCLRPKHWHQLSASTLLCGCNRLECLGHLSEECFLVVFGVAIMTG